MPICVLIFVFIASLIYNAMIPDTARPITGCMGITNRSFGKFAQMCTWLGDLATVVMVWDAMFQDYILYPQWVTKWKEIWNHGCQGKFRVVAVWVSVLFTTIMVWTAILLAGNGSTLAWSSQHYFSTNELSRIVFVLGILLADMMIVMQDWDFPSFESANVEIKVAGTFSHNLHCDCFQRVFEKVKNIEWIKRLVESDFFEITVAGKWMNFGPLMIIIGFDINMLKNQFVYEPSAFGQYTDELSRVWTIVDPDVLKQAFDIDGILVNASLITYEARAHARGDNATAAILDAMSNSRYEGFSIAAKGAFAFPAFCILPAFIFLIVWGNRKLKTMSAQETMVKAMPKDNELLDK